jgi:hypothetical protein
VNHRFTAPAKTWAALTLAIAVSSGGAIAIANASSQPPSKPKSCSTTAPCIQEKNTSSGNAIEGDANSGVGVFGTSQTDYGTAGESFGIEAGVGGFNHATTTEASGVYGSSDNGYGVFGSTGSQSGYGVVSQGNELVEGEIYTAGSCKNGCSKTRGQASFGARSSEPTIEDVGEGVLRNGVARVALGADFANTIDSSKPYVVLLTPEGDASMYVAERTPAGFEVREVGGSHGSAPFAYRIIAKPFGVQDERLPFKSVVDASTLRHGAL